MGKTFDPGSHNRLQKAILEEFTPRFAPGSECLYVGDTTHRDMVNLLTPQLRPTNTSNQRLLACQPRPTNTSTNACLETKLRLFVFLQGFSFQHPIYMSEYKRIAFPPAFVPNPRRRRFFQSAQEEESLCRSFHLMRR
ncbi:BsuBI/PstI family type II restriction endonuclease [Prevotella denticola]|uniref:BsuBI/PstI family type II restriction endonuclease n=1 Tax=Prevotella denticola TaxID=28129 RepID=UPI0021508BAB|nr:BsuBI/PstI family type II restriction endonuclease [Prevotella denticola]